MIYQPYEIFDIRAALAGPILNVGWRVATDFIAGENKSWAYYAGVGLGSAAAATGIPGAAATLYVIADSFDMLFFNSPEGSLVDVFIDGLNIGAYDLFSTVANWVSLPIPSGNAGVVKRVDIVNAGISPQNVTSSIAWMALSYVQAPIGGVHTEDKMAISVISFSVRDADGDTYSVPFHIPSTGITLARFQQLANVLATALDDVIDGIIVSASLEFGLSLPGGLDTVPVAYCEVQKGALFNFTAAGTSYSHGIYIPSFTPALFEGDSVNTGDTAVQALRDAILNGIAADIDDPAVAPSDRYENDLTALVKATKRFRK
ncbi:MAG TPA: hypothetical protein PLD47_05660 [Aggregatilineales bacterium]|nr:hypothetical protein [Anaerolineales bacterium]HRE47193.1 hypothetical protein [Aggregatilineales bacterium]